MTYPTLPPRRASTGNGWRSEEWSPSDLRERRYVVPKFQRPLRWSPDRGASYLQGFLLGEPHTPFVLWAPRGSDRVIVLDGQHRLCALGCDVLGADGHPRALPPLRLDLLTLRWGETGDLSPSEVFAVNPWTWLSGDRPEDWRAAATAAYDRHTSFQRIPVLLSDAPESPEAWLAAAAHFERMARSVPFTESELADLRRFVETPP